MLSFVVAVSFLLLPKRSSEGFFLVFEPVEMVIDLVHMQAHEKVASHAGVFRGAHRGLAPAYSLYLLNEFSHAISIHITRAIEIYSVWG